MSRPDKNYFYVTPGPNVLKQVSKYFNMKYYDNNINSTYWSEV